MSRDRHFRSNDYVHRQTCTHWSTPAAPPHRSPTPVHGLDDLAGTLASTPQFTLFAKVDMTECVALRRRMKVAAPTPTYNDIFVKAAAAALTTFPTLNARFEHHQIVPQEQIDVGIVIATEGSQTFGSVRDAASLTLQEIAVETQRLSQAVWNNEPLPPSATREAAFTVSNLGMYGVSKFSGYVVPHQAAIMSIGAIENQPVVTAGSSVEVRPLAELGLTCDHRIVSAADAAFFLHLVRDLLTHDIDQLSAH